MGFFAWIGFGFIAGAIAKLLMPPLAGLNSFETTWQRPTARRNR